MDRGIDVRRHEGLLDALSRALAVPVPPGSRGDLLAYAERVASWNRKLDLTAARTPGALWEILVADALILSDPAFVPPGSRFVDVGSGAGAPALPLLALRPDLSASLVEPKHKRVAFLRSVVGALGYAGRVEVLERRLDPDAGEPLPRAHDVAMSRATLAPPDWLRLGCRLAPSVLVLAAAEPLPEPPEGVELVRTRAYRLPDGDRPRQLGVYRRLDD